MNIKVHSFIEQGVSQRISLRFLTLHRELWCGGRVLAEGGNSLYPVAGLPVFLTPHAGRFIAGVSGPLRQIHTLEGIFVDVYGCLHSRKVMHGVWDWAERNSYVQRKTLYRIDHYDEESREKYRSLWDDRAQARQEFEALKADETLDVRLVPFSGYGPLPRLKERIPVEPLFLSCVPDLVLACFVTDVMLDTIDGIWWQEEDRPDVQSVPHGVIFPHRIGFWTEKLGNSVIADERISKSDNR